MYTAHMLIAEHQAARRGRPKIHNDSTHLNISCDSTVKRWLMKRAFDQGISVGALLEQWMRHEMEKQ